MKTMAIALATVGLAAAAGSASAADNIWTTHFESGFFETLGPFPHGVLAITFGGASVQGSQSLPGFGGNFLRNDTSGTTLFEAHGLGAHSDLHLDFDLAFIDSWDGFDGSCCSPDELHVAIDGLAPLTLTSNNALGSAPFYGPGVVTGPLDHYGFNGTWKDVVVHYSLVIPHTAADWSMAINFGGAGFQGGIDESWGIDNFSLAATPAEVTPTGGIPEPASWALMIMGFGLAGGALRRRRAFA